MEEMAAMGPLLRGFIQSKPIYGQCKKFTIELHYSGEVEYRLDDGFYYVGGEVKF
ncbi:hypothetical protein LINPERHAP2_LOCUS24126, partial [Linum perenne]